jgi:hypothetical protein
MTFDGEAWGVRDAAALVAEIDRDLEDRTKHFPEQVRKGRINQQEADYLIGLIRDIRSDLAIAFAPIGAGEPVASRVTWSAKVRWIKGELEHRRERMPDLVAKGRITANDAQKRISAMEQLRRLYWERMFQWEPPAGPARDYLEALRRAINNGADTSLLFNSEGAREYREIVRAHVREVELEERGQGELAA